MSVVGIDFGTQYCSIAAAQKGGVDVLTNEVSSRQTSCMVGFGEKERAIGESGLTQFQRNLQNTVTNVKRVLGHKWSDQDFQDELKHLYYRTVEKPDHSVGIEVMYGGENKQFTPTAISAMILQHLKETAEKALGKPCKDVVISVPGYWNNHQRRALLDAASVSGLNCLRLMNDHTATALQYGIYKTNLSETDPTKVMFIDMGYSNTSVSIVEFLKSGLKVVSTAYDRNLGGRQFDQILVDHFTQEFRQKYNIDIKSNRRALVRVEVACEKLKKVLNTVPEAPLNIDSLMNDIDVKGMLKRQEFETMCAPILPRLEVVVKQALDQAGLTAEQLHSIEITGGGTRLLAVQNRLTEFLKRDLSRTMNHEESVVKGCALQCAILSPVFRVREYSISDISSYPIKLSWTKSADAMATDNEFTEVFTLNNPIPSSKMITFYRKDAFDVLAEYSQPQLLPQGTDTVLGKIHIPAIQSKQDGTKVQLKVKLDLHGAFVVESAQMVETIETIEAEPEKKTDATKTPEPTEPAQTTEEKKEQTPAQESAPAEKKKKKVRRTDLTFTEQINFALSAKELQALTEEESKMVAADKLAIETAEKKNAVEAYIYDMRNKISGPLSSFATEQTISSFNTMLEDAENWLYGEGEDVTKSAYIAKLNQLMAVGEPVNKRKYEYDNRFETVASLRSAVEQFKMAASSADPKYEHIEAEEKKKIVDECQNIESWLNQNLAKQEALPKHTDPIITCADLLKKKADLEKLANPILNKPKPKPKEEPKPAPEAKPSAEAKPAEEPKTDTPMDEAPKNEEQTKTEMDLD